MKNLILLLVCLFLASCTVENDDLKESQSQFSDLNAIVEIEGCDVSSYNFKNVGKIEVTNDGETLFVTIASTAENFDLLNTKLHVVNSESDFPTVGRGNLPPGKMEYNKDFDSNVKSHTFEFSLVDLEECIFIASQSTFSNGEELVTTWGGDINIKFGNWSYFQYCIQECIPTCEDPVYTGPSVLSGSLNYTDAEVIPDDDDVRKLFSDLIVRDDYHNPFSEFRDLSRYNPSIDALIAEFHELDEPFGTYDLNTTYTYGTGECAGTIDITVTVIDDREICEDPVYTGPSVLSNSLNYTDAVVIPDDDDVRKLFSDQIVRSDYHNPFSEFRERSRYNPSINSLIDEFWELDQNFGTHDLKTIYSYGTGECAGTIDITVTIIDDREIQ